MTEPIKPEPTWYNGFETIKPFVFKITTPRGSGTGFQISHSTKKGLCGIATAFHVINNEHEWGQPIKIIHHSLTNELILQAHQRVIITYPKEDLAFILFNKGSLPIEGDALKLIDQDKYVKPGVELGWCGFPAVAPNNICFFSGHTSCFLEQDGAYLVDGVAINGVSGGPAFFHHPEGPKICGVISAYLPNRATGEIMPGVSVVRSVAPYQNMLKNLKTFEEAEEKAEEAKKEAEQNIENNK